MAVKCGLRRQTGTNRFRRVLAADPGAGDRAGYPGIAADVDLDKVASVLPAMKHRAFEMWAEGEKLTGHKGLPLAPTPNLVAD